MCWLMAFVRGAGGKVGKAPKHLEETVKTNLPKGNHAWGFASIDDDGRMTSFKEPGVVDSKILLAVARRSRMLVVHGRWATHGSARDNHNNHPHASDGGWIAHNGVIGCHEAIARKNDLLLQTECDSEVLARLIETAKGSIVERVRFAIEQTSRFDALAMLGLWNRTTPTLIAARRGNPLHYWQEGKFTWLATIAPPSAKQAYMAQDNTVYRLGLGGGVLTQTPLPTKYENWSYKGWKEEGKGAGIQRDPSGAIIVSGATGKAKTPQQQWDEMYGNEYPRDSFQGSRGAISTRPPYKTMSATQSALPARYRRDLPENWMDEKVGSASSRIRKYGPRDRTKGSSKQSPIGTDKTPTDSATPPELRMSSDDAKQCGILPDDADEDPTPRKRLGMSIPDAVECGAMTVEEAHAAYAKMEAEADEDPTFADAVLRAEQREDDNGADPDDITEAQWQSYLAGLSVEERKQAEELAASMEEEGMH